MVVALGLVAAIGQRRVDLPSRLLHHPLRLSCNGTARSQLRHWSQIRGPLQDFAGAGIDQINDLPGIINNHALAGGMGLVELTPLNRTRNGLGKAR